MIRALFSIFKFFVGLGRKVKFLRDFLLKFPPTNKIFFFIFRNLRSKKHTVIKVQGSKMLINPEDMLGSTLWGVGSWETTETALFKKIVKEGMVFVDIGANIGYYSLLAATLIGQAGKVYAFEPEPKNYATLLKNIKMNGYTNIITVQKAVSNRNGVAKLFIGVNDPVLYRIRDSGEKKDMIEVGLVTLDDFFKDKERKIDIIKIDVEGAELSVLRGMPRILAENKDVIILAEFDPDNLRSSGTNPDDVLKKLVEHGFKIYEIDKKEEVLHDVDVETLVRTIDSKGKGQHIDIMCKREMRN
jgi:FkbM family methyltransferase